VIVTIVESRAGKRAGRLAKGMTERMVWNLEQWAERRNDDR